MEIIASLHVQTRQFITPEMGNIWSGEYFPQVHNYTHIQIIERWLSTKAARWKVIGVGHRISEVGRGLWISSSSTPLLKAGSARASCSGLCSVRFGRPARGWRQPLWMTCSSVWLPLQWKENKNSFLFVCLRIKWNFPYFSLISFGPIDLPFHWETRLVPCSLLPPLCC